MKKLVDMTTGDELHEGDRVITFRGLIGTLITIRPEEGMNGKVYVKLDGGAHIACYYPSVINAKIKEEQI